MILQYIKVANYYVIIVLLSIHSMARANLNKSVWLVTNTTTASKYIPRRTRISINIPPFRPHFIKFSKTVFYEVNLVSQCSHLGVLLLSKVGSERGNFS